MIKSIRLRNFKSFRDVTVDLERITVLVGRGGTGKSNFVGAIAFLRDRLLRRAKPFKGGDGLGKLLCATAESTGDGKRPMIEFEIHFELPGHDGEYTYCLAVSSHHPHLHAEKEGFFHDGVAIFARDGDKWSTKPAVSPIPALQGLTLGLAGGIPEVGFAYVILTAGIGCYDFRGSVLQPGEKGQRHGNGAGLRDDASNFLECLEPQLEALREQLETTGELLTVDPARLA
jgi:hypothetical protein